MPNFGRVFTRPSACGMVPRVPPAGSLLHPLNVDGTSTKGSSFACQRQTISRVWMSFSSRPCEARRDRTAGVADRDSRVGSGSSGGVTTKVCQCDDEVKGWASPEEGPAKRPGHAEVASLTREVGWLQLRHALGGSAGVPGDQVKPGNTKRSTIQGPRVQIEAQQ
nr:hypothetical protein CFP56_04513 [Quercus suber]